MPRVCAPPSQAAGFTISQVVTAPAAIPPMINHVFVETPPALLTLSTSEYAIDCEAPAFESFRINETGSTEVI
jgi:hypothetical protein